MSQTIFPFSMFVALRQFAQCRRWCELQFFFVCLFFVEMFCPQICFLFFLLLFKLTGLCGASKDMSSRHSSNWSCQAEKSFFHRGCFMGKKCKTPDSSPRSCWVVGLFSRTMFLWIKALVLLFAVVKSVPSPACGRAFIGEVTLMSMQALFYQLTSLHQITLWNLM